MPDEYEHDAEGYVILVFRTKTKTLLELIRKKFELEAFEDIIFKDYVSYMNKESRNDFLWKVFRGNREYINKFLDSGMEKFEEDVYGSDSETESKPERRKIKELYNLRKKDDATKLALLYKGILIRLRQLNKTELLKVYTDVFSFNPTRYKDKTKRRSAFFRRYYKYISNLKQDKFEKFVDDIFDKNTPATDIWILEKFDAV